MSAKAALTVSLKQINWPPRVDLTHSGPRPEEVFRIPESRPALCGGPRYAAGGYSPPRSSLATLPPSARSSSQADRLTDPSTTISAETVSATSGPALDREKMNITTPCANRNTYCWLPIPELNSIVLSRCPWRHGCARDDQTPSPLVSPSTGVRSPSARTLVRADEQLCAVAYGRLAGYCQSPCVPV
jgi:hypothetical protein